jgi:SagB-type dehydrogenase family enzyme
MRYRTSSTLAFSLSDEGIVGFNFLQKLAFQSSNELLELLDNAKDWHDLCDDQSELIEDCIRLGAVVSERSGEAGLEQEFMEKWSWGLPAALYHFSIQGNTFLTLDEGEQKQIKKAAAAHMPELFIKHAPNTNEVILSKPPVEEGLMSLMARRRSQREAADRSVSLQAISEILYSGMGITGFVKNAVAELPLTMTPSGGARNPYEAFIVAKKVEGLIPGIYHYSALDHTLSLVGEASAALSEYVGSQDWADTMSCLIVLTAYFERTMWKYDDPNAYRVVLIEAGHIAQNMLLTATEKGLAACPTAALTHDLMFDDLKLPSRIACAPIYAIALGSLNNA